MEKVGTNILAMFLGWLGAGVSGGMLKHVLKNADLSSSVAVAVGMSLLAFGNELNRRSLADDASALVGRGLFGTMVAFSFAAACGDQGSLGIVPFILAGIQFALCLKAKKEEDNEPLNKKANETSDEIPLP